MYYLPKNNSLIVIYLNTETLVNILASMLVATAVLQPAISELWGYNYYDMDVNQCLSRTVVAIDFLEWINCRMTRAYGNSMSAMSLQQIRVF